MSRWPPASALEADFDTSTQALPNKDLFVESYTHVHIAVSEHRAIQQSAYQSEDVKPKPPELVVALALTHVDQVLQLDFPPGYLLVVHGGGTDNCKALSNGTVPEFSPANVFLAGKSAKSLADSVLNCTVKSGLELKQVTVTKSGTAKTAASGKESKEAKTTKTVGAAKDAVAVKAAGPPERETASIKLWLKDREGISKPTDSGLQSKFQHDWFYFSLHFLYPEASVKPKEKNNFVFRFSTLDGKGWHGQEIVPGFAILGYHECDYSEWSTWSVCDANCGAGKQLRRRQRRSPHSGQCPESSSLLEEQTRDCNGYGCSKNCEVKVDELRKEFPCSAKCGGGVELRRPRWVGEHCPAVASVDDIVATSCNTKPCEIDRENDPYWTVVSECSALCGRGKIEVKRQILQKSREDTNPPIEASIDCIRALCNPLTVLTAGGTMPLAGDVVAVSIVFSLPDPEKDQDPITKMVLRAPKDYKFETEFADVVQLFDVSFPQYAESARVSPHEKNELKIHLKKPIPRDYWTTNPEEFNKRYSFVVKVRAPKCTAPSRWVYDALLDSTICIAARHTNMWALVLNEPTHTPTLVGEGLTLHATAESIKKIKSDEEAAKRDLAQKKTEDGQMIKRNQEKRAKYLADLADHFSSNVFVQWCSPTFPCEDSQKCVKERCTAT